jgi:beta-glucanase (GH16 family)
MYSRLLSWLWVCAGVTLLSGGAAHAQTATLFRDDFSGSWFDTSKWMVGNWSMHRTRFGNTPAVSGGSAALRLDTYNPSAPGWQFRGTEILTKQKFARPWGKGLEFESRVRMRPMSNGLVTAMYGYAPVPYQAAGTTDEIDFEFLSNWVNSTSGASDRILMTTYDNWNYKTSKYFDGVHHTDSRPVVSGLDMNQFNTFTIRWLPSRTDWLVNGRTIFSTTKAQADEAMPLKFNFWAPNTSWWDAYSSGLMPTSNPWANRSFYYDVDYATVRSITVPTYSGLSVTSGTTALPEPGTGALVLVAGMGVLRRRVTARAS